jgi:hypothetical protein
MIDKKSVASIIKTLERTIGVLENCSDLGEISDITRKRIIEMLNTATMGAYFLNNSPDNSILDKKISVVETIPEKESENIKPIISEEIVEENVPEVIVPEEVIEEIIVPEEVIEEIIVPEEIIEEKSPEEEILEEEIAPDEILEEEIFDEIFEDENIFENIPEEIIVPEEIIQQLDSSLSDKPIIEWETLQEPVIETPVINREEELNKLQIQLEEERKRLEQDLQSWNDEKSRRDEELIATKKLLEALQQQTRQPVAPQPQPQPVVPQPRPQPQQPVVPQQPIVQQPIVQQPVVQKPIVQQPQVRPQQQPVVPQPQPVVPQPRQQVRPPQPQPQPVVPQKEPLIKKEEAQDSQNTLSDSFIGSKKVLHETFESGEMVNKLSTPVSSLQKAIGINDKFRFIKELFGGDSDLYTETITKLDTIGSLVSAISYIESNFYWDKNSESVKQLISLIRRRYM